MLHYLKCIADTGNVWNDLYSMFLFRYDTVII